MSTHAVSHRSDFLSLPKLGPALVSGEEVEAFRGAVISAAQKFYPTLRRFHTLDDLIAIGMAVTWASLTRWRDDGGASRMTFVSRMLRYAYLAELKHRKTRGRLGTWRTVDLDEERDGEPLVQIAADEPGPDALLDERRRALAAGMFGCALAALSETDRKILERRYQDGWSLRRVGAELGVSHERVRQREEASLKRIRRILTASSVASSNPEQPFSGAG